MVRLNQKDWNSDTRPRTPPVLELMLSPVLLTLLASSAGPPAGVGLVCRSPKPQGQRVMASCLGICQVKRITPDPCDGLQTSPGNPDSLPKQLLRIERDGRNDCRSRLDTVSNSSSTHPSQGDSIHFLDPSATPTGPEEVNHPTFPSPIHPSTIETARGLAPRSNASEA